MSQARCASCNTTSLVVSPDAAERVLRCIPCGATTTITAFPALDYDPNRAAPPPLASDPPGEGEAACFYTPTRKATKECSHCGVLISDPWAASWGSQTVCLKCLDHLRSDTKSVEFQSKRTLWDNVVLMLALLPFTLILWWSVFVTAPAALFLGFWHWNSPRSIVPRGRGRLIAGIIVASLQLLTIVGLIIAGGMSAFGS